MQKPHSLLLPLVLLLVAIAALRVGHLTGPIDDPHSWRQCDVANYAYDFYKHGIDLLHPSVCWMGSHKTVIFEFPLVEAIMAMGYHVVGGESLLLARLVGLVFFLGSAIYLFLFVRHVFGPTIGLMTLAIYGVLPLGLFYSRAVHVDFPVACFAHAMAYYVIRGYDRGRSALLVLGVCCATIGFLIKAPCVFFFALPIGMWMLGRFDARKMLVSLALGLIPVACFLIWRHHVEAVNAASPDWTFIPHYRKLVHMEGWYYGDLAMRADPAVWQTMGERMLWQVASPMGLALFALGVLATTLGCRAYAKRSLRFAWAWLAGTVLYFLIFTNVNQVHNYYQIPFLGVVSLFGALGLDGMRRLVGKQSPKAALAVTITACLALAGNCIYLAEHNYYIVQPLESDLGDLVSRSTPSDALLIAARDNALGLDPRALYHAHRNGWAIAAEDLTLPLIRRLQENGAQYLVLVTEKPLAPGIAEIEKAFGARLVLLPPKAIRRRVFVFRLTDEPGVSPFVRKFYKSILHRAPDAREMAEWTTRYAAFTIAGIDVPLFGEALGCALLTSKEYKAMNRDRQLLIKDCYKAFLRRRPTAAETVAWGPRKSLAPDSISALLANSWESAGIAALSLTTRTGDPAKTATARLYLSLLHRLPSTNEAKVGVASGGVTPELAIRIIQSKEYRQMREDRRNRVIGIYRGLLGRFPEGKEMGLAMRGKGGEDWLIGLVTEVTDSGKVGLSGAGGPLVSR